MSLDLPIIRLSAAHRSALEALARSALDDGHPVAPFLLREVRRAEPWPDAVPPDTVALNNWVTYRLDWGFPSESRLLVAPEDHRNPSIHLSVLSPLGAALLGLPIRARMPYRDIDGTPHVATAESLDPPLGLLSLLRFTPTSRRAPSTDDFDDPGPSAA